ncbi:MAG TPA: CoA transferase [Nocardioidaceae bacterium]|nr:CoA transferase [Nocardioidaceae bacterium]
MSNGESPAEPLEGIRVLELGSFIAGPSTSRILGEFGAEVIKIERPRVGDEIRRWRTRDSTSSLLWQFLARNKKSVTVDLRQPEGRRIALGIARECDVLVENFRPGTLERWGLSPEELREQNPDLVVVRISGYGQSGPYRDRPGFGGVAEALGGVRYLTGHPELPPTRVGVALADSLAGLYGVIGALMGLLKRGAVPSPARGETVDVALYEAVFAITETLVTEFEAYGTLRERTGSSMPGIAPSNTYPCKGDNWVVIGGNADGPFHRLMLAIGREDLADDVSIATNEGRVVRAEEIDDAIAAWTSQHEIAEVVDTLAEAGCPAGPIYSAADILADPHFRARQMLVNQKAQLDADTQAEISFPGVVPKLTESPGHVRRPGPGLGEDTEQVLHDLLGLEISQIDDLRSQGVI